MDFKYEIVDTIDANNKEYVYVTEVFESDCQSEISLCTLSAINWGKIKKTSDFEKPCTLAVRALDAL